MKLDHLKRRGYRVVADVLTDSEGKHRHDITVTGRRSRKQWLCAAKENCTLDGQIDFDEVYVEVAEGESRFTGRTNRYHMPCAMRAKIIEQEAQAVDKGNNRRAAIAMTKAKREAAGEC